MSSTDLARKNRTRAAAGILALLFSLSLVGCDPGGGGGGDFPPPPPPPPPAAEPDEGCLDDWPTRITLIPGDNEEQALADTTPLCESADGRERVIINNSDAVWFFADAAAEDFVVKQSGDAAASFRDFVENNVFLYSPFVAPTETLAIPVDAEWHIDRKLTKTWLAHDIYLSTFSKYSTALQRKALTRGSKSRQALFDCTLAYLNAVDTVESLGDSPVTEQQLLDAFSVAASTGTCAASWRAAETEAGNQKFPTYADDIVKAGSIADNVTKVHTGWGWVRSFCAGFRYC